MTCMRVASLLYSAPACAQRGMQCTYYKLDISVGHAPSMQDHRKRSEASAARELWQVDGHSSGPTKSSRPSSSPSQSSTATATATSASAGTSSSNQAGSVPNGSARASAAGPFADGFGGGARGVGPMVGARMEEIQRELVRRGQERLKVCMCGWVYKHVLTIISCALYVRSLRIMQMKACACFSVHHLAASASQHACMGLCPLRARTLLMFIALIGLQHCTFLCHRFIL